MRQANEHRVVSVLKGLGKTLLAVVVFFGILSLFTGRGRLTTMDLVFWTVVYGMVAGLAMLLGGRAVRHHARTAVDLCLKLSACPSCGYDLQACPADPRDGCTVCPECGAAWKLTREVEGTC